MSWFDTTKLASMANKAMKEAQKTLDSALDISEEQAEEERTSALWSAWKTSTGRETKSSNENRCNEGILNIQSGVAKSESEPQLVDKAPQPSSGPIWGSFSGPLVEEKKNAPVSSQPQRLPVLEDVSESSSSVLSGVEELGTSWDEQEPGFTSSRLVVRDREYTASPESGVQVELQVPEEEAPRGGVPEDLLSSVELASPQSPCSSIELVSPPSNASPSVEVVTPPEQEEQPDVATSASSSLTLVGEGLGERLAEAMVEETASVSSSCRSSDIVKVESVGSSGDELEEGATATSSDIEVLSYRGHQRGGSDQSSQGEEVEALRRKARDLEQLVAAREARLVAVSKEVAELRGEVEEGRADRIVVEELRRRVALLEQDVAGGVAREQVNEKEVEQLKKKLAAGAGDDLEKDEMVADLRSEGEALARQNGKQAEVVRKLRAKEKSSDTELIKLRAETEKSKTDVERLTKSLEEKNGVEGSQSEAIKKLTEASQAWEAESRRMGSDLEDSVERVAGLRQSLESAYREMAEMKRKLEEAAGEAAAAALSREVSLRKEAVARLEEEGRAWEEARLRLEGQVRGLQSSATLQEEASRSREELYRQEVAALRQRLEQSDSRHEDLAESVGLATKPLLRQIETLQANLRESTMVQEQVEAGLNSRLQQTASHLAAAQERERAAAEQYRSCSSKVAGLEARLVQEQGKARQVEERLEVLEAEHREVGESKASGERAAEAARLSGSQLVAELQRDKQLLEASLEAERAESEGRRRKGLALAEQLRERDRRVRELQCEMEARASHTSSPTPSLSRLRPPSSAGSESFTPWPEEAFTSSFSTAPSLYETQGRLGSTASLLETLQAQLKQREGEVAGLLQEVATMHRLREGMSAEMTKLTIRSEQVIVS